MNNECTEESVSLKILKKAFVESVLENVSELNRLIQKFPNVEERFEEFNALSDDEIVELVLWNPEDVEFIQPTRLTKELQLKILNKTDHDICYYLQVFIDKQEENIPVEVLKYAMKRSQFAIDVIKKNKLEYKLQ